MRTWITLLLSHSVMARGIELTYSVDYVKL